jgi:hypothetical protein
VVAAVTLGLRLATAASGPTDWDSAQYAAGVARFDVTHGRPQPPGYWLYVVAGRWVVRLTGISTIHALVVVSALASAAAAGVTVSAGSRMGGRWLGVAAGAVVATSPFVWFSGSVVATYSFDALACAVLLVLAWDARPGSWHGIGAVVALGLLSGFRPSILQAFAVLALLAVVGSTRTIGRLVGTVAAGAAAVAVWFLPMVAQQPGGLSAWTRATHAETVGAVQVTSVLDHAAGARTNLGIFAATTVVALAPVAVVGLVAGLALAVRRLVRGPVRPGAAPDPTEPDIGGDGDGDRPGPPWRRPWYQGRAAVLGAALVPPMAIVALVQFAKGGYVLAYLPAAVIALLLPAAALTRRVVRPRAHAAHSPRDARRTSVVWAVVLSVAVGGVVALGAQRFLAGGGVLPQRQLRSAGGLWLQQARYQAPYPDTRPTIRAADRIDAALVALRPTLDPSRDVVVFDTVDGGDAIYRNAGWALPDVRVTLIQPGGVLYNQLGGSLFYARGTTVAAGPDGTVFLVSSPVLPGLATLTAEGYAIPVDTPTPIGGYLVWRLVPGATVLGVTAVSRAGPRPLGGGI